MLSNYHLIHVIKLRKFSQILLMETCFALMLLKCHISLVSVTIAALLSEIVLKLDLSCLLVYLTLTIDVSRQIKIIFNNDLGVSCNVC